jgi:hypothetical protein
MVKSLPSQMPFNPFNVKDRVADAFHQKVSNTQAYDIIYPNHQAYYEDKKFHIFDSNFQRTEDYLLNEFKKAIDEKVDYSAYKNIQHVDDIKQPIDLSGIDVSRAPRINADVVQGNIKYTNLRAGNVKHITNDPYQEIMGKYS